MLDDRSVGEENREAWGSPHASFHASGRYERREAEDEADDDREGGDIMRTEIESPALTNVRALIEPITADLGLDVYDLEHRGATLRVTLDTPPGSTGGVTLDILALASRLVSKELDQHDPIPSRYTLEVTSPGVERSLRLPSHFQREVGKLIAIRLSDVEAADRRLQGVIVAADDHGVTIRLADGSDRTVDYGQVDRARTVFEWGPKPKPGGAKQGAAPARGPDSSVPESSTSEPVSSTSSNREHSS
jgi:ribosome maturation factor RimP